MKFRHSRLYPGLAAVALGWLGACSILPGPEAMDVYLLPAPAAAPTKSAAGRALPWSLRVVRPSGHGEIAGQRIAVIPAENRLSVYQGVRWNAPAGILIRDRLLDAFHADGRIGTLSSDEKIVHADFELDTDLQAFQAEYRDGGVAAVLRLDARLVRTDSRRVVASRRFEARQAADGPELPLVVRAFGAATGQLARELVDWTVQQAAAPGRP